MFVSNSLLKPSNTMPFGYVGVVIGFASDVLYFGVDFNWLAILGMLLTSIGLLGKLIMPHDESDRNEAEQKINTPEMGNKKDIVKSIKQG